jgi:RNA polymerase sigma factor (sigma-70 family)
MRDIFSSLNPFIGTIKMRTEDGYIIQQCLDGDNGAYGFLVEKYKKAVYALAYSRIGDFHDAQDITQEVFVKAYKNLHTLRRWDNFMGWLYRITSNLCKDWYRLRTRRPDLEFIEDQKPDMLDHASMNLYNENVVYESLQDTLDSLPDIYRQALVLRYFGGMRIEEISSFLGISPDTVDRRLKKALSQLKEEILAMIGTAKEQHNLPATFTFQIIEMVKHIRINPISIKPLPWGLSLTAGIIALVFGIGQHLNWQNTLEFSTGTSVSGESKVLEVGEYPVNVFNIANIPVISNKYGNSYGLGSEVPSLQNAIFMAPQAGDTWTKKADMPTARGCSAADVVNGKIYVIGGYTQNQWIQPLQTVEEYDPVTNKWTRNTDMPTARMSFSISVVDGKIYAIGGEGNAPDPFSIVEEYDPLMDKWTRKADMPTARSGLSTCAINGKIYAIGGYKWDNVNAKAVIFSIVEEYDPKTDTWTKKTDMPTKRSFFTSSAGTVNGQIYVIGGGDEENKGNMLSLVEQYDPTLDKWTKRTNMPTARVTSIAIVNGKIYAIGGYEGKNKPVLATVEEYDPGVDGWVKKNDMPTARTNLSTCAINGKIYAIGGLVGQQNQKDILTPIVEEYNPGTSENVNLKGKLPTTWGEMRTVMNK